METTQTTQQNTRPTPRYSARLARKNMETPEEKAERLARRRQRRAERKERERRATERTNQIIVEYHRLRAGGEPPQPTRVYIDTPRIPQHLLSELVDTAERAGILWNCPVCLEDKPPREMVVSVCGHKLCGGCKSQLQHPECPECRGRI